MNEKYLKAYTAQKEYLESKKKFVADLVRYGTIEARFDLSYEGGAYLVCVIRSDKNGLFWIKQYCGELVEFVELEAEEK